MAPVLVRSIQGTIRGPDYVPGHAQPKLSLDLLVASSGEALQTLHTNEKGEFHGPDVPPGLYFLRLTSGLTGWSGEQITGLILVDVVSDSRTDHLDLDLGWSSCGLSYADASNCPRTELHLEQLAGEVLDAAGVGIPRAKIVLVNSAGVIVEQLLSDEAGKFHSSHPLAGAYELVVSSAGFTTYRRTLHMQRTGARCALRC